ncbi:MAG: hypothetical protein Fur0021_28120 [Candidatus Promineifilaceae bacterium]
MCAPSRMEPPYQTKTGAVCRTAPVFFNVTIHPRSLSLSQGTGFDKLNLRGE